MTHFPTGIKHAQQPVTSLATTQATTRRFRRIEWMESHLTLRRKRAQSYPAHPHGGSSAPHRSAIPEKVGPHPPTPPALTISCPNVTPLHPAPLTPPVHHLETYTLLHLRQGNGSKTPFLHPSPTLGRQHTARYCLHTLSKPSEDPRQGAPVPAPGLFTVQTLPRFQIKWQITRLPPGYSSTDGPQRYQPQHP